MVLQAIRVNSCNPCQPVKPNAGQQKFWDLDSKADGTVIAWGQNDFGQTNVPAGLANVQAISAGGSHSLALKNDGTVVAWGNNSNGQTNVPINLTNVFSISAGGSHSLVITNR